MEVKNVTVKTNNMLIKKQKRTIKLGKCPIGLFLFDGYLCLKTEYYRNGKPECYIVSSGEFFVGGVLEQEGFLNLIVTPLNIEMNYFDNVKKAIEVIEKLDIDETSKQGGISALKLVLNEQ